MSSREVQIVTCDRCGHEQTIGITDSTCIPTWLYLQGFGDLCPTCAKEFRHQMVGFFGDKVPTDWNTEYNTIYDRRYL